MASDPTPTHEREYLLFLEGIGVNQRFALPEYASDDYPSTPPPNGTMFLDTDRGVPAWWDGNNYENLSFVHNEDVLTTTTTVANTTTDTEVYRADIDDTALVKGRVFQMDLLGKFSTVNNSDTFNVNVHIGGNDVGGVSNTGKNVTDAPWSIEFTFTVDSVGENATMNVHTRGLFDSTPADSHGGNVTLDTTTPTSFSVSVQWSSADAGNSVTLSQAFIQQMA